MRHVVMFSGGIGSWATASRVADEHGTDSLTLLFADTLVEDADTYRFLHESAEQVGGELVIVKDGRTPFEVFHDEGFLGNSLLAHCSRKLKSEPCRRWVRKNCDPKETTLYVGLDWTETHRLENLGKGWHPFPVLAPMAQPPYIAKGQMIDDARRAGLEPPLAYAEGFPHANCLDQGCIKGGQAYWETLLRMRPEVYAETEEKEAELAAKIKADRGTDSSILKVTRQGETHRLTLREFREQLETQPSLFDNYEWGGCGCFSEEL